MQRDTAIACWEIIQPAVARFPDVWENLRWIKETDMGGFDESLSNLENTNYVLVNLYSRVSSFQQKELVIFELSAVFYFPLYILSEQSNT